MNHSISPVCLWFYKRRCSSHSMKSSYGPDHSCNHWISHFSHWSLYDPSCADLCLFKASHRRCVFLFNDIVEPCGMHYWLRNPFFSEGLTAFSWCATVYFVNRLIICHPQSVWVWNISFVLWWGATKPSGQRRKASSCRARPGLVRDNKWAPVA